MKPLNSQHFETFVAVADNQSITKAALSLGLSKAAVSQSIKHLEKNLGLPLLIRTTRSIGLTEEGELLLKQCRHLQHELNLTRNLIKDLNDTPTGTLSIVCSPYFAESHLFDILQTYLQDYPKVNIKLLIEERMPNMIEEKIDVVFGVNWPTPPDVVAKIIAKTRYVLCASPDYLEQFGTPLTLHDLKHHQYIPHSARQNLIVDLKKPQRVNTNSQLTVNNSHFLKLCAIKGMGIVQLHDYMVKEELKSGALIEVLAETQNEAIPLFVYYQKHRFVQPKIKQLITRLLKA